MLGWPFADQSDTEQRRGAIPAAGKRGVIKKEYKIEDLTKEEAAYIGAAINAIVPHEVDADEEEFILKVENENGEIVGGCIAEAYEYRWSRMFLDTLWVDERYRHHGIGSMIIHEVERIASEKGCRVVTLGSEDDAEVIENGIHTYSEAYWKLL